MPAKRSSAKKTTAKKATAKKATTAKKPTTRANLSASGRSATAIGRSSTRSIRARRGDLLIIDSAQVGSPARQGEILKVLAG